ncbi:MAG: hypothetical protein UX87_C0022G0021 [Candidatus Amesbacteria bacterium GW2011_GWA1_47_16]|uniref:Uncharacterized protein n=4 Tax=Candidatus Amesiibacteriota TaxID=1752730 RepID=A0A0G1S1W0_9BACT|nr:MAG: hypothetical protein UX86_C0026G0011 [Candidatus Amesbacteria bacterium GW2011_GWC1_47_15]KKU63506.1 MAG: hypothetical protein UX87_C0022G0021 [Candidatus Amesbacteria bacterium GW2011_GWA1_47_16]KKU95988.1 MAG: hypothetical protein UY28_C0040G0005 [Candidatus Amesbacteria bacterium GW2011_GWB1_48_13]OGC99572.1 MAG: hypothetical protein A2972_02320 [Candidatus Amesbacteria bacterium RIFCSPLOWO2_01_FULL_47_33]
MSDPENGLTYNEQYRRAKESADCGNLNDIKPDSYDLLEPERIIALQIAALETRFREAHNAKVSVRISDEARIVWGWRIQCLLQQAVVISMQLSPAPPAADPVYAQCYVLTEQDRNTLLAALEFGLVEALNPFHTPGITAIPGDLLSGIKATSAERRNRLVNKNPIQKGLFNNHRKDMPPVK